MQKSNNEAPVASHPSRKTTERPTLTKRSKTISDDTHFTGPLFPAVRRNDKPCDLRVSIYSDSSSSLQGSNGFNERDRMYPSFLGPQGRSRVKVKANNKSQKLEFNKGNEESKRIQELGSKKEEEKEKKEVKKVTACRGLVLATRPSSLSQPGARTRGLKSSLMFYLVSIS